MKSVRASSTATLSSTCYYYESRELRKRMLLYHIMGKHNFYIYVEFLLFINLYSSDSSLASRISIHNLEGSLFKWANESRPMVDRMDQPTIFAHPYSAVWGKLLKPELRRSQHINS